MRAVWRIRRALRASIAGDGWGGVILMREGAGEGVASFGDGASGASDEVAFVAA